MDGSRQNAPPPARCLLLVGEAGAVPSSLVSALNRRGLETVILREAPEVMVELAAEQHARRRETNSAADLQNPLSLVIVEPEQQLHIDELRQAIDTYHPGTRCWRYAAHGRPGQASLQAFDAVSAADHARVPTHASTDARPDKNAAEPTGFVRSADQRLRSVVVRLGGVETTPLVSEEELAMLLGPAPMVASESRRAAGPRGGA